MRIFDFNKNRTVRIISFLTSLVLLFNLSSVTAHAQNAPYVLADSVVLMEASTGQILFSKSMNTAYPPASTTKVMTALLTLENCDLDEMVTVTEESVGIEGSKIWILDGEQISVRHMLYALVMESANDVATALAIHVGGSVEGFVQMMNDKAEELGLENTHFMNPHGLYNTKHKTSANDLALIMREAVKYPEYIKISKTRGLMMPPTSRAPDGRPLWNGNKLVLGGRSNYAPVEAGKTGYTIQSQFSYVASAQKDGLRLIAAFVHDPEKRYYSDAVKLFDYGFDNFKLQKVYSKGDIVTTVDMDGNEMALKAASDLSIVVKTSDGEPDVIIETMDDNNTYYPGDTVTTAVVKSGSRSAEVKLLATSYYSPKTAVSADLSDSSVEEYSTFPFVLVILIIILLIFFIRRMQIKKRLNRKNG